MLERDLSEKVSQVKKYLMKKTPAYDGFHVIEDDPAMTIMYSIIPNKIRTTEKINTYTSPSRAMVQLRMPLWCLDKSIPMFFDIHVPVTRALFFLDTVRLLAYPDSKLNVFMLTSSIDFVNRRKRMDQPLNGKHVTKTSKISN